ncbi:HERV-H LTR-associating protein 2 isoform X2 [Pseudochaenichthys georgianus]|uniref:HERV-H LTR-associating protein 2 isoform X2 n=1 Tax=Pseudochaenichthys georgianus TaxID=52239 RepID=UPI00146CCD1B|nr:uncharacterized protein hhla2b.2 isoform X2 [Pseudochaenichthys georgianus]
MSMECFVFFGVLTFLLTTNRADVFTDALDCLLGESCVLPCSFQPGAEVIVHWIQLADSPAHSYYHDQDQLGHQNPRFRDRTSLFKNQISGGNASLLLSGVKVEDEGRYKCYTSTVDHNKETFIHLNVYAPVLKVDIQQAENKITCSSEGIYPEPQLTWSIDPPPNETITVHQTEQKLYNISSSLNVKVTDVEYNCTVSTGRNKMAATLFKQTSLSGSRKETTMRCTSSKSPPTGLIWRFNHSQIIVSDGSVMKEWMQQVKSVSPSGNLTLKDLSTDHDGIYTCELRTAEGTYVTNTFLRIEHSQGCSSKEPGESGEPEELTGMNKNEGEQ